MTLTQQLCRASSCHHSQGTRAPPRYLRLIGLGSHRNFSVAVNIVDPATRYTYQAEGL